MKMVKSISIAVALAAFIAADILFTRSLFCRFHPRLAYWVLHVPVHYMNLWFLFLLYHSQSRPTAGAAEVEIRRWHGPGMPVFGLHLKGLLQISTNFFMLYLIGVFKEPLSVDIPNGLDLYLLGSTAFLILYSMIVSSYLPEFDTGVNLTASLTGLYISMLYNITGISFHIKGVALLLQLCLVVVKIYIEFAIEGLHQTPTPTPEEEHHV